MKKKEVKKVYAPLVSEEIYEYPQSEEFDVAYKTKETEDGNFRTIYSFRCPKCGHAIRDQEIKRTLDMVLTCPECGYTGFATERNAGAVKLKQDIPYIAKIFKMADGSSAVTFLVKRIWFLYKNDILIYKTRTWRARLIFNKNGHTYYKSPVFVKSGRKVDKMVTSIIDVTYKYDYINSVVMLMMNELEEKGYLAKNAIEVHRFPNLSQQCKAIMRYMSDKYRTRKIISNSAAASIVRSIKPSSTDEDVLNTVLKKMRAPKSKAFLRMFYADPMLVWNNWSMYKNLGMKDINSFYKFGNSSVSQFIRTDALYIDKSNVRTLAIYYMQTLGESAFADVLANYDKVIMFVDASKYAVPLAKSGKDITPYLHRSIRKTHDELQKIYAKECQEIELKETIKGILWDHQEFQDDPQRFVEAKQQYLIHNLMMRAERVTNNKIGYSKEERSMEYRCRDIEFYLPPDTDHLIYAGEKLHNCVGNLYRIQALHHETLIVLMRKGEHLVGCIEVYDGKIRQAYGPCNKELQGEELEAFLAWKEAKGFGDYENHILCANPLQYKYDVSMYDEYMERVKKKAVELNIAMPVTQPECRISVAAPF